MTAMEKVFRLDFGLWIPLFLVGIARAEPTTLPRSPEGAFEVHEWVILICDPNQPQANASSLFLSTLPDFIGGRRNAAPVEKANEPGPIGVIRFSGNSGGDKVDVLLENKGGKFLAHWPKAQTRTTGLLWQNMLVGDQPATGVIDPLGASSWINQLRTPAAPSLLRDGKGEKFLLYDAEPNYKLPLRVLAGPADLQYQLTNSDKVGLKDLIFYKKQADGWHTARLADLPPTNKAATKPATMASTKPATMASTKPAEPASQPTTLAAATKPTTLASTQPSSRPATQPAGFPIALAATGLQDSQRVLIPWKQTLTTAGLQPTDLDLILKILEKHALDANRLTAVYRLEADQLDQLLPLDVVPSPRKTVRVGLVIVKNIDPAITTEIETLAAQLGDPKWDTREAAQKRLTELGIAAKPKLETLLKSAKDPEVVYRIERLIAALTREPGPGTDTNVPLDR
jgi:hypothetical protein